MLSKIQTQQSLFFYKKYQLYILAALAFILLSAPSPLAMERISRLGVGFSGQMKNDIPALSFKLQKSKSFAFGGLLGFSNKDNGGGHAAAIKIYRNIFDEPHLTFYGSVLGGIIKEKNQGNSESGFQADLTLGSEFSFAGLQSLGFSLEFGVSFYKLDDFVTETVGNNFLVAAVHFYL
ncbi:MAG: hypothetical protein CME60_01630 [Halobacteriovoraceae bacterium]|jgi:hypothetical protein|nr:hypothetical protein [Halobacteriovoraceae bacterium]|tara:strand:+ start:129 stop:662 length:534 start_codon:yes stop_codon:yes gene_type:complete